jgi:hypothetical protein
LEKDYGVIGEDDSVNYVDNGIDDIAADSTPAIIDTPADISQMQSQEQNAKDAEFGEARGTIQAKETIKAVEALNF